MVVPATRSGGAVSGRGRKGKQPAGRPQGRGRYPESSAVRRRICKSSAPSCRAHHGLNRRRTCDPRAMRPACERPGSAYPRTGRQRGYRGRPNSPPQPPGRRQVRVQSRRNDRMSRYRLMLFRTKSPRAPAALGSYNVTRTTGNRHRPCSCSRQGLPLDGDSPGRAAEHRHGRRWSATPPCRIIRQPNPTIRTGVPTDVRLPEHPR